MRYIHVYVHYILSFIMWISKTLWSVVRHWGQDILNSRTFRCMGQREGEGDNQFLLYIYLLASLSFPLMFSLLSSLSSLLLVARNAVVVMIGALVGYTLTTQVWFNGQLSLISTEQFSLPHPQPPNITVNTIKVRMISSIHFLDALWPLNLFRSICES